MSRGMPNQDKGHKLTNFFLLVASVIGILFFAFANSHQALASASQNVLGWAWSQNIGWISFNNTSGGGSQDYGVNLNTTTGEFSGYAWSENIGWISFNRADTGAPPAAPYNGSEFYIAKADLQTLAITGWARALGNGDGWDGWIKLAGTAQDSALYSVNIHPVTGQFQGFAWGGDIVGWISFNCSNTNYCATTEYHVNSPFAPIAQWRFDEGSGSTSADGSGGGNPVTLNGIVWKQAQDCWLKGCVATDSVGDKAVTGESAVFNTKDEFTYSIWFKYGTSDSIPSATIWPQLMANGGGDTQRGYGLRYELPAGSSGNSGKLYFEWGNQPCDGSSFESITIQLNMLDSAWHMATVTYDGATFKAYIDSDLAQERTHSGGMCNLGSTSMLMGSKVSAEMPDVAIDEAVIYSYARTDSQIRDEYLRSMALELLMDDGVTGDGKTVVDTSINANDGITHWGANVTGMNCALAGKIKGGCKFDGIDDYVDGAQSEAINQTVEVWVRPSLFSSDNRLTSRVSCGNGRLRLVNGYAVWEFGDAATCQSITSKHKLAIGAWQHIAATNTNGALKLYVNGVLDQQGSYTIIPIISPDITIGSYNGISGFFGGVMDELRIYPYERTPGGIKADMEGVVSMWLFDEGTGVVTAFDESFNRNNGAINGAVWSRDAILGSLLKFDGFDDYVRVPDYPSLDITNELTVSAWVQRKSSGNPVSDNNIILSKPSDHGQTYDDSVYQLSVSVSSGKAMWQIIKVTNTQENQETILTSATVIALDQWYFLVGAYKYITDGASSMELYVNGVLEASSATARGPIETSAEDFSIGKHSAGGDPFDGLIDDVRIYPRALSAEDISRLTYEHFLQPPQNVANPPGAAFNTNDSITFTWDPAIDEANSYVIYASQFPTNPNIPYDLAGISNATSFILQEKNNINGKPLSFAQFVPDTVYTVKVMARDVQLRKFDSLFSLPVGAATSAGIPIPQTPTATPQTITWNWTSGGGESGYFAQIKEDAAINSGWIPNTQLSWLATGLSCGVHYTLQIKARNSDNDETAFAESTGTTSACTWLCVNAFDCQSGEICLDSSGVHSCAADTQCLPFAVWCNKLYRGLARDGLCNRSSFCNLPPQAGILVKSAGSLSAPFQFTGDNSDDDYTPLTALQAQWDFDYDGSVPSWDIDYSSDTRANAIVQNQYTIAKTYKVALEIKDADGAISPIAVKTISLAGATTKIIAIAPRAFPATNVDYSYNFGSINASGSKAISVLICNMGTDPLLVSSITVTPTDSKFLFIGPSTFNLQPSSTGPPAECTVNNDSLSWKQITVQFNPGGVDGVFTGNLAIVSNADIAIPQIILTAQAALSAISPTDPVEKIIYDGRILINPPPGFVEFLENFRFIEPAKP